ncbi:MAG: site-specific integrase, partial [Clostridia bacterium]|nr:site-specific integrase [Clostridia bacterium]
MASVIKRGNTYTIRVSLGYDINGKQIQKFTTWKPSPGMTKAQIEKELERQKILFEEKCRSGRVLDSSTRFGDYAEYWMQEYAEKQLRASTISGYKLMLRRIVPALGHIRLE